MACSNVRFTFQQMCTIVLLVVVFIYAIQRFLPVRKERTFGGHLQPVGQRVPHKLHFTYKNKTIPRTYIKYIESWTRNHPAWEVWFWSDENARIFIRDNYPQFLQMYDGLANNLQRSDAMRYFILYHNGGVYADMDMLSLKPLDAYVRDSSGMCVLPQEPSVQTRLFYHTAVIPMNALMICAERHRFMRFVIEKLKGSSYHDDGTLMHTGPLMLHRVLTMYKEHTKCDANGGMCDVIIAPERLFIPQWDTGRTQDFREMCSDMGAIEPFEVDACHELKLMNFTPQVTGEAYTNHLFLHIGWRNGQFDEEGTDIANIVSNVKQYQAKTNGSWKAR